MPVLDASVAVSFCLPDDINHSKALSYFAGFAQSSESLIAPELIRLELVAALRRRKVDSEDVHESLVWLHASVSSFDSCDDLLDSTEKMIFKSGLRAGDAFYVACAQANEQCLVTFDRDQAERAKLVEVDVVLL